MEPLPIHPVESIQSYNVIRSLQDLGVEVVLASGNTSCFMDALCKMVGTHGTFIAENGGVFRFGFNGQLNINGDQKNCKKALKILQNHYHCQGIDLELYAYITGLLILHLLGPSLSMK